MVNCVTKISIVRANSGWSSFVQPRSRHLNAGFPLPAGNNKKEAPPMKARYLQALVAVVSATAVVLPGVVSADTATGTLGVKITITSNCAVSTSNATLDFGSHASTDASASANNGGFTVSCTNQTPYDVGLAPVSTASTDGAGEMKDGSGTNSIAYQLYSDAAMQTAWGNDTGNMQSATGTGSDQSYTVYGKVTGSMNVPAGNYNDTVTINVTY